MFTSRYAKTDPDINLDEIGSPILRELVGCYDSICAGPEDQEEIIFIDPYKRFFFSVLDRFNWFRLDVVPKDYDGATAVCVPTIRAIYVTSLHRGKGLQEMVLRDIISISEATGGSISIFADPFAIVNDGRFNLERVNEALAAFKQLGYEPTENYLYDLIKQRERFLRLGFKNCIFSEAQITEPFQHFLYVPSSAPEAVKLLQNELEVSYTVDWSRFNESGS